jgi:hypothetical protein
MFYYLLFEPTANIDEIYKKIIKSPQLIWIENCIIKEQNLLPRSIYFQNNRYNDLTVKQLIIIFLQNIKYTGTFELYKPLIKNFDVII